MFIRLLAYIALIFLVYRYLVRPLLVLPKERPRPRNREEAMMDWLREELLRKQEGRGANPSPSRPAPSHRRRPTEEEYTDYEEVD